MIVVSACLAGMPVRYDGQHKGHKLIQRWLSEKKAIPVCPELLGGLQTPREPAEIVGGTGDDVLEGCAQVIDRKGNDVSDQFIAGAYKTLRRIQELDASLVVLKEDSPSCGSRSIYSGSFNGEKIQGNGVTAALLKKHGIEVCSEHELINQR
ncbi:DUF523 domain-containing protein [Geomicrobium sp. JCM 19038]|uniref:DUF523 domain-containing protein n=1 Tax=Geomicrobium sp. JCM 19038 TaxID=1460635 RepID=UPI00045F2F70|nr:DUF523 domain-containing protein [Geomicrobium sp. JCM 19038]GAK08340.1 purine nucleoside phosphorylase [Geomicrobium sp. JCM 19038]